MNSFSKTFAAGMKAAIPVAVGYIPVAIAYAILARQAGLTIGQTISMSLFVYTGASQIMAAGMIAQGAGLLAILITTFLLNLRHLIMSTCVMNEFPPSSLFTKLIGSFWITDETFAVYTTEPKQKRTLGFFFGLCLTSYLSWVLGTVIGCFTLSLLPQALSIAFGVALYAMFIALIMPGVRENSRLLLLVLLAAVINFLLSSLIGSGWSLILSTLISAWIGVYFVDLPEENA